MVLYFCMWALGHTREPAKNPDTYLSNLYGYLMPNTGS